LDPPPSDKAGIWRGKHAEFGNLWRMDRIPALEILNTIENHLERRNRIIIINIDKTVVKVI
jgi:hypothetical protein